MTSSGGLKEIITQNINTSTTLFSVQDSFSLNKIVRCRQMAPDVRVYMVVEL